VPWAAAARNGGGAAIFRRPGKDLNWNHVEQRLGFAARSKIAAPPVKSRPTVTPFSRAMLTPLELGRWFFLLAVGAYPRSA
jgi:hypothetical protein